jgi:hypothetical protein
MGRPKSRYDSYLHPPEPPYRGMKLSDDFDWDTAISRFKAMMKKMYRS